jgi:ABC-2 type transport system permease protein
VNSLRDEIKFLFSGQGMPYEKVCIMVAMVITLFVSVLLTGNIAKDVKIVVIDLDNSAYTRELTNRIDASEFMNMTAVLNTAQDPKDLFYQDRAFAVVYFPRGL